MPIINNVPDQSSAFGYLIADYIAARDLFLSHRTSNFPFARSAMSPRERRNFSNVLDITIEIFNSITRDNNNNEVWFYSNLSNFIEDLILMKRTALNLGSDARSEEIRYIDRSLRDLQAAQTHLDAAIARQRASANPAASIDSQQGGMSTIEFLTAAPRLDNEAILEAPGFRNPDLPAGGLEMTVQIASGRPVDRVVGAAAGRAFSSALRGPLFLATNSFSLFGGPVSDASRFVGGRIDHVATHIVQRPAETVVRAVDHFANHCVINPIKNGLKSIFG